jgi:hypothetical protein
MAFPKNGVVEAPKIVPSAFGILAVVDVSDSKSEDAWVRGFSQEWETDLHTLMTVDDTDLHETTLAGTGNVNYYDEVKPFFVEVQEDRSTLGFLGIDRIARIKRQCEATSQRAIEEELWDGAIRIPAGHGNAALTSSSVNILDGAGLSARRALAVLEHGIARASHAGEQGVIHATRDIVAVLSSNSNMLFHEKVKDHLQTMGGTPVVVGSGYTGNGPRITVLSASISSNILTLNTAGSHYLQAGDYIKFSAVGANVNAENLDGDATVASVVDSNTITVAFSGGNQANETVTGFVQMMATNTDKWIYGTGTVKVYLGEVDVVNDKLGQAYDVAGNQNDMRLKAIRPAAAYFDPSIHLAVRVDLTA